MLKKSILIISLFTPTLLQATPLVVNPDAQGKKSEQFLEKIEDQMAPYVRALSYQKPSEFSALQFATMLNESANIEKKLDILIAEIRETNRLLKAKKSS
tara:strand:- start:2977 stop:3273 length:297 start_codon:yes stop_codon:yes gene_type:complete